ncbi:MAG: AraC family transcriptional regulator [Methyloceanibacter sp.]|uniref:AraC family transcriptional regulator n=1 Tax=Methyloceanibacter sp. TaxID=1965321 RepID=UPI003D6D201F
METQADNFGPVRFSTDELPARDRVPVSREVFGRLVFRTEIEPASSALFHADVTVRNVPGLTLVSSVISPVRLSRTPALLADGNDDVALLVSSSPCMAYQRGREVRYSPGEAVALSVSEIGTTFSPSASQHLCIRIRRAALAPLVANLDDAVALRQIPPSNEALQYLLRYIRLLQEQQAFADPALARSAALHLRDLIALLLGPTRDAAFVAEGRGLAAARLQAIKGYVADHLGDGGLTVGAVAARHRVTPRYVQRLFESEGTTFSEFLLDQRLARARQMLADPRYAGWRVSAIALEAGFGDVSYFNRCFRRRFGESPGHIRPRSGEITDFGPDKMM